MSHNDIYPSLFEQIKDLYNLLSDQKSKDVFLARITLDLDMNLHNLCQLVALSEMFQTAKAVQQQMNRLQAIVDDRTPIYIYGSAIVGELWCRNLLNAGANVVGFYDRRFKEIQQCAGLPVLPPPQTPVEAVVFDASLYFAKEIHDNLREIGFAEENIFPQFDWDTSILDKQYFEFMDLAYKYGAFVDAGCFDCSTSIHFHSITKGNYTKILAFEPDPVNLKSCQENANRHRLHNVELFPYGLSDTNGTGAFLASGSSSSLLTAEGDSVIELIRLDDIVDNTFVSFIKMDIEGSELSALQGAQKVLCRDKPLCAISVYHKPGDIVLIMNYLKNLVPEYRFAVRHYSNIDTETVLYAFVPA